MDRFAELKTFCAVAAGASFSVAARQLGLATSSVTRLIDSLEQRLGVVLLNRSTRKVTLTEAGRTYRDDAQRILDQLDAADDAISGASGALSGTLRVTAPVAFATLFISPILPILRERHPALALDLRLSDTEVGLVDESIDVAIRIGALDPQSTLVARRLSGHQRVLCASPAYLERRGTPVQPLDLTRHDALHFAFADKRKSWRLRAAPDQPVEEVALNCVLQADHAEPLRQAALAGMGVAMLARWLVDTDLREGRLVRVLEHYEVNPGPMDVALYALYQANRRGSHKIRAFVELLAQHLDASGVGGQ